MKFAQEGILSWFVVLGGWIWPEAHHWSLIYSVEGMHMFACMHSPRLVMCSHGPKAHHWSFPRACIRGRPAFGHMQSWLKAYNWYFVRAWAHARAPSYVSLWATPFTSAGARIFWAHSAKKFPFPFPGRRKWRKKILLISQNWDQKYFLPVTLADSNIIF